MIAVLLSPIYILVILYLLRWNLWWFYACSPVFKKKPFRILYSCFFLFISCSMIIAFFIRQPHLKWFFKHLSNYWLGTLLYIVMIIIIGDIIRLILKRLPFVDKTKLHAKKTFVITGAFVALCIVSVSAYGILHARNLKIKQYEVTIEKACELEDLKIVLIADLHMGYSIGHRYIEKMVDRINALEPDLICIAGDIYDNDFDALDDPAAIAASLKKLESTYGTFACWGNHDISEKILVGFTFGSKDKLTDDPRMAQLLTASGITLLNDEVVSIEDAFYLAGRKDIARAEKVEHSRKSPEELLSGLESDKPIIVLEHQPKYLEETAAAGADLHLAGHTHNGQLFPGNLFVGLTWDNPYGLEQKGDMASIVTSGIGIWGPDMRVGTDSEIVEINVSFQ